MNRHYVTLIFFLVALSWKLQGVWTVVLISVEYDHKVSRSIPAVQLMRKIETEAELIPNSLILTEDQRATQNHLLFTVNSTAGSNEKEVLDRLVGAFEEGKLEDIMNLDAFARTDPKKQDEIWTIVIVCLIFSVFCLIAVCVLFRRWRKKNVATVLATSQQENSGDFTIPDVLLSPQQHYEVESVSNHSSISVSISDDDHSRRDSPFMQALKRMNFFSWKR